MNDERERLTGSLRHVCACVGRAGRPPAPRSGILAGLYLFDAEHNHRHRQEKLGGNVEHSGKTEVSCGQGDRSGEAGGGEADLPPRPHSREKACLGVHGLFPPCPH